MNLSFHSKHPVPQTMSGGFRKFYSSCEDSSWLNTKRYGCCHQLLCIVLPCGCNNALLQIALQLPAGQSATPCCRSLPRSMAIGRHLSCIPKRKLVNKTKTLTTTYIHGYKLRNSFQIILLTVQKDV